MSDTRKKAKQPKKRKSVKGARRASSSSVSTGRLEQIVSEARAELASEPILDPKLDLPFEPKPDPKPDSKAKPSPASSANSAEAAGASGEVSDASKRSTSKSSVSASTASTTTKSSASKSSAPKSSAPTDSNQTDSASNAAARSQQAAHPQQKTKRSRRPLRWVLVGCALIVCVLLVSIGVFAWDRWLRYDDVADIQGSWTAAGTQITIEIDESSIQITEDVAYEYSLDTNDKTITFTFGDMSGSGQYSFSADRNTLVIDEQASVDLVADFLAFYHLDVLFGLGGNDSSQGSDADETGNDETSDDDDQTSSSVEDVLSLTLERLS